MAEESAKLRIPYIAASQAQKHVTHNEGVTLLDTLVQLSVLDKDLTAPPGSPAAGDTYIVAGGGGTATGAWVGWEKRVARYIDGEWRSYLPGQGDGAGWLAWVLDEDGMYRFDGSDWDAAGIEGPQGATGPAGTDGADGADGADGDDGQSFQPDAAVALIAGRDTYDDEAAAFSVLVVADSTNSDLPTLYFKLSATNADWSGGITFGGTGGGSSLIKGHLFGLTLSNNGADATNDIDIAVGEATSDDGAALMVLGSGITKRLDASWAVGTGNGGLDTGSIADTTYHCFLIQRSDTGVVDVLYSASATSPTMPTNYDRKRIIGPIVRVSGAIVAFTQSGDEFLLSTPVNVVNQASTGTSAVSLTLANCPSGVEVRAMLSFTLTNFSGGGSEVNIIFTALDQADVTPTGTVHDIRLRANSSTSANPTHREIRTNTSAQMRYRASASSSNVGLRGVLHGWVYRRGRDG